MAGDGYVRAWMDCARASALPEPGSRSYMQPAMKLSFGNFAATDTSGANAEPHVPAIHDRPNALQIDIPSPSAHIVSVTDFISKLRTLAAYFANFCH